MDERVPLGDWLAVNEAKTLFLDFLTDVVEQLRSHHRITKLAMGPSEDSSFRFVVALVGLLLLLPEAFPTSWPLFRIKNARSIEDA